MNKKVIIAVGVIIVILGAVGVCFYFYVNPKNANSSRRDGQVVASTSAEDDLNAVNGELDENYQQGGSNGADSEAAKQREQDDSALYSSLQSMGATEPVSESVESVEVILLPEAISIADGDPGQFYGNDDFSDVVPVDIHSFSREDIPTKYDSRNVDGKSYITDIEDQGYTSLCWTYAALGAIESDLLLHNESLSRDELDLSEKHLAYSNMHRANGSVNGYIDGDYREFVNADNEEGAWIFDYDTNYVATGGVADFCISLLTAWKGPVSEKGSNSFKSLYGEKNLFKDNADVPSDIYESEYHVQNVCEVPAGYSNNTMIKQMIMEHGSVTAGVYADDRFWKSHNSTLYADFGTEEAPTANHEVLIIGWDDEYSKDNFTIKPKEDGAWICKNSWGSKNGIEGCFYLSYYDQTTGRNNVAAYSSAVPGQESFYDNNYQAAGFLTYMVSTYEDSENYVTTYSSSVNPYGMLYKAVGDETMKAIGLMGLETYQQYEFDIYVNPENDGEIIEFANLKKPDLTMKASAISGGYHTFELPEEIELAAGDEFFILVRPVTSGRLIYEPTVDSISKPNYDEWNNLTGNVHNNYTASGCSFYIASDGTGLARQDDKDFFVKAYTVNR
ncbi:C1 family peptidase [Butyrivibrio sp. VCB2006]|uniref:C1 family peptidase n=1 Tax=Butyrivibrio sp. VCB2006 TaxID=1280679 RepID=UPI0003FFE637|nr:C1 family peptidase [Butyrivibrio sp. VCB2006]